MSPYNPYNDLDAYVSPGDCRCKQCESARRDQASINVPEGLALPKPTAITSRLATVVAAVEAERAQLQADAAAYRAQRDDAQQEAAALKRRLDVAESKLFQLNGGEIEHLRDKLSAARVRGEALEGRRNELRKDLNAKTGIVDTQRAAIAELKQDNVHLERRCREMKTQVDNLRDGPKRPGDGVVLASDVRGVLVTRSAGETTILFRDADQKIYPATDAALLLDARWPR